MRRKTITAKLGKIVWIVVLVGTVLPTCGCTATAEEILALVLDSVVQSLSSATTTTSS